MKIYLVVDHRWWPYIGAFRSLDAARRAADAHAAAQSYGEPRPQPEMPVYTDSTHYDIAEIDRWYEEGSITIFVLDLQGED